MNKNHSTNKERSYYAKKIASVRRHIKAQQSRKRAKDLVKLREYWQGVRGDYPL